MSSINGVLFVKEGVCRASGLFGSDKAGEHMVKQSSEFSPGEKAPNMRNVAVAESTERHWQIQSMCIQAGLVDANAACRSYIVKMKVQDMVPLERQSHEADGR